MATKKKLTFEQQLSSVEALIEQMESGALPLEEAMKRYEEGIGMLTAMEKELQQATQRLTVIRQKADGTEEEIPMEEPQ